MKANISDLKWGVLLFAMLVFVLVNPFKANLREYYGGHSGCGCGCGCGCRGCSRKGRGCGYKGSENNDVLPRDYPFPLGYY